MKNGGGAPEPKCSIHIPCPSKVSEKEGEEAELKKEISNFMKRQLEEQKLAKKKEKIQVCIKPDSYIGKEIQYQTALLHEILDEIREQRREKAISQNTKFPFRHLVSPVASWNDIMASTDTPIPDLEGRTCFGGISFNKINGFVAVILIFAYEEKVALIQHTFICRQDPDLDRVNAPIEEWVRAGEAEWVDAAEVPAELVAAWFREKKRHCYISKIAMDSFRYPAMHRALKEIGFDAYENKNVVLTRPSDIIMAVPDIETLFKDRKIIAGDTHIWRWYVNNAVKVHSHGTDLYEQREPYRKADGFLAFVEAFCCGRKSKQGTKEVGTRIIMECAETCKKDVEEIRQATERAKAAVNELNASLKQLNLTMMETDLRKKSIL